MSRSKWKCPYSFINFISLKTKKLEIHTYNRSSIILPSLINKTLEIHNGKKFIPITITKDMVAHKLGEFAPTRAIFKYTKKNKKKK